MNMSATGSMPEGAKPSAALQCLEIWGGNHRVSHALELPGLVGWLHSDPIESSTHGGDVHYVSVCSKGVLTRFAVADVAGHGQSAGSVAATLRSLIHKHIDTWDQSELMRELNESLRHETTHNQYASAMLFAYYAPTRELVFTNAGHPPALWYRADAKDWEWLDSGSAHTREIEGLPLGLIPGTNYLQSAVRLSPGDILILYTDGISEARNADGEMMDRDALIAMVRELPVGEPAEMTSQFLDRMKKFRGTTPADDDQTFCILRQSAAAKDS
jgi:sigma-B regulation protein RsbU (phosphoserine phosphatase)